MCLSQLCLGQKPAAKKSGNFPHLIKLIIPGLFLQLKQSTEQHEQELAKRDVRCFVVGDIFPAAKWKSLQGSLSGSFGQGLGGLGYLLPQRHSPLVPRLAGNEGSQYQFRSSPQEDAGLETANKLWGAVEVGLKKPRSQKVP